MIDPKLALKSFKNKKKEKHLSYKYWLNIES